MRGKPQLQTVSLRSVSGRVSGKSSARLRGKVMELKLETPVNDNYTQAED